MLIATALQHLGISAAALAARGLEPSPEAEQLVVAEIGEEGREHLLIPEAAEAWSQMKSEAAADGITLFIVSAYRSIERQVELIQRKLAAGQDLNEILSVSAPPGFSEHHSGRAVDIGTPGVPLLDLTFAATPAFSWLQRRAAEFRYKLSYPEQNAQGFQYEPWHWCFSAVQQRVAVGRASLRSARR